MIILPRDTYTTRHNAYLRRRNQLVVDTLCAVVALGVSLGSLYLTFAWSF